MMTQRMPVQITIILLSIFVGQVVSRTVAKRHTNEEIITKVSDGQFEKTISGSVYAGIEKTYLFTYTYAADENWAINICVNSTDATINEPILIVARRSLGILSWKVPMRYNHLSFDYEEVCHTLCPLNNYVDARATEGLINFYIDLSTSSKKTVHFDLTVSNLTDYLIGTNETLSFNITPFQPRIVEYHIPDNTEAVLIKAKSSDKKCLILAIQDIHCPFYDSETSVQYKGFYQRMTLQSGVTVTRRTFHESKIYVVMVLKATDHQCTGEWDGFEPTQLRVKEVVIEVVPTITGIYYLGILVPIAAFVIICIIHILFCCYIYQEHKTEETRQMDSGYGIIGGVGNSEAELNKDDVRLQEDLHISDMLRKNERILRKKSSLYSWSAVAIAVFYFVPAVQVVIINQKILSVTGNQDLCYYNFYCAHKFGFFSDFNHFYSNIGYCLLGLLFLIIVWFREHRYSALQKSIEQKAKEGKLK